MRIAIDAMGGDCGPRAIIAGALAAARDQSVGLILVGRRDDVRAELDRARGAIPVDVTLVDADEVVGMEEPPAAALRRKPGASIRVAAGLVQRGEAAALFSAGNTGATVVAACSAFGMLDGVARPALATTVPTRHGGAVLLDAGANAACRPRHLVQFAIMGSVYARVALGIAQPRIGLLSTGAEETKGNALTREAHRLLKAAVVGFIGNVEAHEVFSGRADVLVCDGFTGNIALKVTEGLAEMVVEVLGDELSPSRNPAGTLALRRVFRRLRRKIDYSEYGGAPLLGVAGLAVVGHGRSSPKAVRNAVAMASRFAAHRIVERIGCEIASAGVSHA
ncbi:MAG: phosphate acyltransferase PlsX [Planctomycetes bacterium]|nr:phosphate acyltransferase PlsX [Planctomycetota bacterium]